MKWIKASERLPEKNGEIYWKSSMGIGFEFYDGFFYNGNGGAFECYHKIEWLDESAPVDDVVKFAEWILKEAILPRDTYWFDAGKKYTSEELYELFKGTPYVSSRQPEVDALKKERDEYYCESNSLSNKCDEMILMLNEAHEQNAQLKKRVEELEAKNQPNKKWREPGEANSL